MFTGRNNKDEKVEVRLTGQQKRVLLFMAKRAGKNTSKYICELLENAWQELPPTERDLYWREIIKGRE